MCEFEKRLIAWIDRETDTVEALEFERHLRVCPACSVRAGEYRDVSRSFAEYCGTIASLKNSRRLRWAAFSAAVVAAVTAAMVMLTLSPRVDPLRLQRPAVAEHDI